MNWNTVEFIVGPVPNRWLEIADEKGVLILNDFPLWTLSPEMSHVYRKELDVPALRREHTAWLGDSWNHPSVVFWAASLESKVPVDQSTEIPEELRVWTCQIGRGAILESPARAERPARVQGAKKQREFPRHTTAASAEPSVFWRPEGPH